MRPTIGKVEEAAISRPTNPGKPPATVCTLQHAGTVIRYSNGCITRCCEGGYSLNRLVHPAGASQQATFHLHRGYSAVGSA